MPNSFGIVALEAAYNEGEEWLEQLLEYLNGNMNFIDDFVTTRMPEIKFIKPEGTYLAWLDFSALGFENEKALETWMQKDVKLALDEGYIFGKGGEGFERVNVACPRKIINEALTQIEKAIKNR